MMVPKMVGSKVADRAPWVLFKLIKTVEAFEENDISNLVKRKTFDLKVVTDHLEKAMSSLPAEAPGEW